MTDEQFGLIEWVFGFGVFLAWAIWEIVSVRRSQRRDRELAAKRAQHPDGDNRPDEG